MQLNLRHVVSNEILIYPGYVPVPGVRYRVFHYGLEYRVGNWSFDKAQWRHTDVVNKCGTTFPDPPDTSTLDRTNEDSFQRDLLSIECAESLNEALRLHHERRNCSDPNSLPPPARETRTREIIDQESSHEVEKHDDSREKLRESIEIATAREFEKVDETDATSKIATVKKFGEDEIDGLNSDPVVKPKDDERELLSPPAETNQTFTWMRFWIIGLWVFAIFSFMVVMFMMISRRKGHKRRGKSLKSKRRNSSAGFWDMNGNDRHVRSAEV